MQRVYENTFQVSILMTRIRRRKQEFIAPMISMYNLSHLSYQTETKVKVISVGDHGNLKKKPHSIIHFFHLIALEQYKVEKNMTIHSSLSCQLLRTSLSISHVSHVISIIQGEIHGHLFTLALPRSKTLRMNGIDIQFILIAEYFISRKQIVNANVI